MAPPLDLIAPTVNSSRGGPTLTTVAGFVRYDSSSSVEHTASSNFLGRCCLTANATGDYSDGPSSETMPSVQYSLRPIQGKPSRSGVSIPL